MEKMKAGFTGFVPKGADYFATLQTYAQIGYRACESGWGLLRSGIDPQEGMARIKEMGLRFLTVSTSVQGDRYPDIGGLAEQAHRFDVDWVTIYHSSATSWRFADRPSLPDYDEAMREIEKMEKLAVELEKEGLLLQFHNHDQEFLTCYKGVPLFWHIAAKAEHVKFELDLGWVQYAGVDPAGLIAQLGDRINALHVKDYARGENYENKPARRVLVPRYTAPGTGMVDLEACLRAAYEAGVRWAIIEQDMQYHLTMEEAVRAAYYNMKETGFVE